MSPICSASGEGGVGFVLDGERRETDLGEIPGLELSASLAGLRPGRRGGVCGVMGVFCDFGEEALMALFCAPGPV